ncbi:MAG: hypothetical protein ABIP63_10995, partial [Thermoanaerobaculia bacterium]
MMLVLLAITLIAGVLLAALLLQTRSDLRKLVERLHRSDPESGASLGADSFGAADELAAKIHSLQSQLRQKLAAAEWQTSLLQHLINGMGEGVLAIDQQN